MFSSLSSASISGSGGWLLATCRVAPFGRSCIIGLVVRARLRLGGYECRSLVWGMHMGCLHWQEGGARAKIRTALLISHFSVSMRRGRGKKNVDYFVAVI